MGGIIIEPDHKSTEEPSLQGGVERQRILELATSVWAFSALAGACEGGILDVLGTPKTAAQIGEQVGTSSALAEAILDVLATLDLVQVVGDTYVFSAGMSIYIGTLGKDILRGDLRATQLLTEDFADPLLAACAPDSRMVFRRMGRPDWLLGTS